MKKRVFYFDGSDGAAEMMAALLNHYADVAYPMGGSDCAAASREALHAVVNKLMMAQSEGLDAEISKRQRPLLKSAINWFYTESEYASPNDVMYDRLLSQFQR